MNDVDAIEAAQAAGIEPGGGLFIDNETNMANPVPGVPDGWLVQHHQDGTWTAEAQFTEGEIVTSKDSQPLPSGGETDDSRYNDEIVFLNGLRQSSKEFLGKLSPQDQALLNMYYAVRFTPPDIFAYRREILRQHPELAAQAQEAFKALLQKLNIQDFAYTTYLTNKPGHPNK